LGGPSEAAFLSFRQRARDVDNGSPGRGEGRGRYPILALLSADIGAGSR